MDNVVLLDKFSRMSFEKNRLPLILTALLFISAAVSAGYSIAYVGKATELRGLQGQAAAIENNRVLVRSLANDAVEYSRRNPAINPILQSFGLNVSTAPAAAPASPKAAK